VNYRTTSVRRFVIVMSILLLVTLFLSACGGIIETDLTLYSGDRFDATSRVTVPAASLALVGGAAALDAQFNELEQQALVEGARFSWRKENSKNPDEVVYRISTSGTGYDNLSAAYSIQVQKVQHEGKDALSVSASPSVDMYGTQNTLRLHVGKILQTNNQRSGNNTIVWTGTEMLQAIVTPASSTNWLTILLVVLAVAAVAAIALVVSRRRPASQVATVTTAAPIATRGGFCPHCGEPTQPGAKFCMSCGQAIPPRQG